MRRGCNQSARECRSPAFLVHTSRLNQGRAISVVVDLSMWRMRTFLRNEQKRPAASAAPPVRRAGGPCGPTRAIRHSQPAPGRLVRSLVCANASSSIRALTDMCRIRSIQRRRRREFRRRGPAKRVIAQKTGQLPVKYRSDQAG